MVQGLEKRLSWEGGWGLRRAKREQVEEDLQSWLRLPHVNRDGGLAHVAFPQLGLGVEPNENVSDV